jgi:hypothetical protein
MWQDDMTVSCAVSRGHPWDVRITEGSRSEGGLDVKDALDDGANHRFAAGGGEAICAGGTASRRDLWRGEAKLVVSQV